MRPVLRVENLGKQYRIGGPGARYNTARESLMNALRAPVQRLKGNGKKRETIWALKDVNLEVSPGEVLAVIGRNGAGKSTLLKILSRITRPTTGSVDLYGRVGSLLEVGTGFHQELTGRENIYLNGAILGMKKTEIERKFDQIVAFAETEQFLDTPVKHYSSGMYVRLAFAVAAHLEPEILLIDEVLAVGDYAFQQKCIKKAGSVAREGRTVLLVSHNLAILGEICASAVWIDKGRVKGYGPLQSVIRDYVSSGATSSNEWVFEGATDGQTAVVNDLRVYQDEAGMGEMMIDRPFNIELTYTVRQSMPFCRVGVILSNTLGVPIFSSAEPDDPVNSPLNREPGIYKANCTVPGWLLAPDTYFLTPHIDDAPLHRLFTAESACSFLVVENVARGLAHHFRPGVVAPKLNWNVVKTSGEHGH